MSRTVKLLWHNYGRSEYLGGGGVDGGGVGKWRSRNQWKEDRPLKLELGKRVNLPAQPFILRSAVVPFDQFIQGFKTFLGARPPGFVSLPGFFLICWSSPSLLFSVPRSLFRRAQRHNAVTLAGASRERNFLRRWRAVQIELWTTRLDFSCIAFYNLAATSRNTDHSDSLLELGHRYFVSSWTLLWG